MTSSALPLSAEVANEPTHPADFAGPIIEGDEVRRKTQGRVVSALIRISFFCGTVVVCQLPLLGSESHSPIICREQLSVARREMLVDRLRTITGFEVTFDENGGLRVTSAAGRGGSQTARNLIATALNGKKVIVLEDASDRQDVVFSRVVSAEWKHHASNMPPAFVVLIDFADFDHLLGDREALKAFDVGWAFLHELEHVVNESADTQEANQPGECEDHINLMRNECGLPLRADYFYTFVPYAQRGTFRTRFVRLAFEQKNATTNKGRRYWVMWDATLVGGLAPEIAAK